LLEHLSKHPCPNRRDNRKHLCALFPQLSRDLLDLLSMSSSLFIDLLHQRERSIQLSLRWATTERFAEQTLNQGLRRLTTQLSQLTPTRSSHSREASIQQCQRLRWHIGDIAPPLR